MVPILPSVVSDTMTLRKTASASYFTEKTVTSTAAGMADCRMQMANWSASRHRARPTTYARRGNTSNLTSVTPHAATLVSDRTRNASCRPSPTTTMESGNVALFIIDRVYDTS